jgi:hypothetical protein
MNRTPAHGEVKHLAMQVHKLGFLLDRLGQDCHPLQFLRELTQNSIEAIKRTQLPGEVIWDVDWLTYDLGDGIFKLSVTDSGDGMTGEQMLQFINHLSSSGGVQSMNANYGVGAKIAAATRNPFGVVYNSWKDGQGSMVELRRDEKSEEYGLRQFELADGTFQYYLPLEDDVKPPTIQVHGTKVVLLGRSADDDTMRPPENTPSPSRWISKYLNSRYFKFPVGVTVKAREGWENPRTDGDKNVMRTLVGQERYLSEHCEKRGISNLSNVRVHWWILKDEPARGNNSGFIESSGHVAALYQDELYERLVGRAGTARLQQFGITFGAQFVVLYLEPKNEGSAGLTTNTARTSLLLNETVLPWEEWAEEFRNSLPTDLAKFVEEKSAGAAASDHTKSIKERLRDIMDLYRVSRYRPSPEGTLYSDSLSAIQMSAALDAGGRGRGSNTASEREGSAISGGSGRRQSDSGNIYHMFEKKGGVPADKSKTDPFPDTRWISLVDGSRGMGELEDRAAKYLKEQNLLLINADFSVFADMIEHFWTQIGKQPGTKEAVQDVVRGWFEQAIVETILGLQALKNRKEWSAADIEKSLSEEALTAVVMQRYHVNYAVRRELGAKFGKLGQATK